MNDVEDLLRDELRARVEAAEARQADKPPVMPLDGLAQRIRRARVRRIRWTAGIGAVALAAAVVIPVIHMPARTSDLVHQTGAAALPLSDTTATPGGWVAVAYGDAQISVPARWRIASRLVCGRDAPGYVVLGSAATTLVVRNPRCKQAPDMAAIQVLPDVHGLSPRWSGQINRIRVLGVRPPARGFASYLVPALHAVLTARGPLAGRILGTLTRSPLSVVLAPGPQARVPPGWRWHDFGGISFATPAAWRVVRSRLWFPCWNVVYPAQSVKLVTGTRKDLTGCPVPPDIAGFMRPNRGVAVGFGRYVGLYDTSREIGCRHVHGLRGCFYSPSPGRPLELAVFVPGRGKPTVVEVGLRGTGLEARTIVESIRPR